MALHEYSRDYISRCIPDQDAYARLCRMCDSIGPRLSATEGILPALESSHAIAYAMQVARERSPDDVVVVCLSGRGDKDAAEIARLRGEDH